MTPVLVFLTNKTLYVTDLVRNRLCNKFVLPYTELDVILVRFIKFLSKVQLKYNFEIYFQFPDWTTWQHSFVE